MKSRLLLSFYFGILTVGHVQSADAALISRLGGQFVYDTDRNITWLADANAGAGSTFDDGGSSTDGLMSWGNATAWATSLTTGGYTDWRLPTTLFPDSSCPTPSNSQGGPCTGSEMGHLFYQELGGPSPVPGSTPVDGILASGDPDLALFTNIQSTTGQGGLYWSSTEKGNVNQHAWIFSLWSGNQSFGVKGHGRHAWAVREGDVSSIPLPAAIWLLGTGILSLAGIRRIKST